ncbi:MAG: c-type cytochrome [Burkholderiales bacterium]|nr:c-type cytochrome [Burkholderiales bacterium]
MKNQLFTAAAVAALALCMPALATAKSRSPADLAAAKQCMQCHKATEEFAGPSFRKIAASWNGQRDAVPKMSAVIRRGSDATGGPHWGQAKMPDTTERPAISRDESRRLARWVLQQ